MTSKQPKNGFTLLELTIVIAIISLIVGGIVVGQSVIRTATIQAMLGENDKYTKAVQEFVDKYQTLPGDMSTASSLWGAEVSCGSSTDQPLASWSPCNGNANGKIDTTAEKRGVWQHMYKARLLDISFTGRASTDGCNFKRGVNVPPSELGPAAWVMQFVTYTSGNYMASVDSGLWRGTYGNAMFMGAVTSSNGTCFTQPYGPVLYASEAYEVDKKIDDGKPALGKVRAWNTHVTVPDISDDCTMNDTSPTNANYKVSAYRKECALVFITGL